MRCFTSKIKRASTVNWWPFSSRQLQNEEVDVISFLRFTVIMSKREVREVRDEGYPGFGFTLPVLDGVERPPCIFCNKVSNCSLK